MEVREGFKQTDVGGIPENWDVKTFKDISWVNQGLQIAIEHRRKNPSVKSKVYITIQYLKNHKDVEYIDEYSSSVCCDKNDILMTRTGNTGNVVTDVKGVFHNNFFKINYDKKQIQREFLLFFLQQNKIQHIILTKAGTSTIPDLNHNDFYSIPVILPPLLEQRTIATALSDVDALITSLDRLIAKKRNIKQAAMQELLTGRKRLPGFNEEWEVIKLGDMLDYEQPTSYTVKDTYYHDENDTPVLTANKGFILGYTNEIDGVYKNIPVIIFDDFTTASKFVNFPFKVKSGAMKFLKTKNEQWNLRFIFEKMQIIRFSVGDHKRYYISEYQFLQILVPKIKEQNAIVSALSDMDTELAVLEQKRDKTKAIKQGMMQELLTGRIRLV